jgi:hypothetical protein
MTLAFRSRERRKNISNDSTNLARRKNKRKNKNAIEHSLHHRVQQSFNDAMKQASVVTPIRA